MAAERQFKLTRHRMLASLNFDSHQRAARLLAVESGVDERQPSARVHLSAGLWLTLRAVRIGTGIAVTIQESAPAERLGLFTRASALSTRESELLTYLASGASTREIASRMFLSEHTVQDHLKSVFAKTQTEAARPSSPALSAPSALPEDEPHPERRF